MASKVDIFKAPLPEKSLSHIEVPEISLSGVTSAELKEKVEDNELVLIKAIDRPDIEADENAIALEDLINSDSSEPEYEQGYLAEGGLEIKNYWRPFNLSSAEGEHLFMTLLSEEASTIEVITASGAVHQLTISPGDSVAFRSSPKKPVLMRSSADGAALPKAAYIKTKAGWHRDYMEASDVVGMGAKRRSMRSNFEYNTEKRLKKVLGKIVLNLIKRN